MISIPIEIPPSQPEKIQRPGGDPGQIEDFANRLHSTIGKLEEYADSAKRRADTTWSGDAASAYYAAARKIADRHDEYAEALQQVSRACLVHADTLEELQREWRRLVARKKELDDRHGRLWADALAVEGQSVEDEVIAKLQHRAVLLTEAYADLVADDASLQRRTRENEEMMISAFSRQDTKAEVVEGSRDPVAAKAFDKPGAPGPGAEPHQVRQWWQDLSMAERDAVIAADPRLIGRADGLPAKVRDEANRLRLTEDLKVWETQEAVGTLSESEQRALRNAKRAEAALREADSFVDRTGSGKPFKPGGQLWLYDPTAFNGDGKVAIAVGDLDTADDVAVRVPGMMNNGGSAVGLTREAMNVYQAARYEGDGSSVASMFWLGYNSPSDGASDISAGFEDVRASNSGRSFADAVEGLRASRPEDRANLTAIGHSYGSTTVAQSASQGGLEADQVVLVGSPGVGGGIDDAADLNMDRRDVFVGRNSHDLVIAEATDPRFALGWPVAKELGLIGLGVDPARDSFGAVRFEAEDVTRGSGNSVGQHSRHFAPNTESLYNIGRIVDGQAADINRADLIEDRVWRRPDDPERDREPSPRDSPGRSRTDPEALDE